MSGGSKQQTTTTNNAPWKAAQPALQLGLNQAQKLFNQDPTGQKSVYTGSTVVPWSQQTKQAMGGMENIAFGNAGGRGTSGEYRDIINQGGFNDAQKAALNNTQATANSNFDINANPAFQQVLQQAQSAARDSVNLSAGGAGRYGSGVHQGNLASEVGDLTSRMVGSEYQNWQNRRDAANSNLFNMGQQGIGNLGTAYQGLRQPAQDLMQIGAMNEDLATRQMNDKLRIFNDKNNAGWNQLGRLNAIASGAGALGGSQTQSQPGQNPFLTALGYGTTGLGLLGGLF
ncbi:hypothetical protein FA04_14540 [Ensifer adhaerens]|uniref:Tail fiber domain-containing protein n=1 Tax=Ensifer adhaerens TaxID=106592 RepID=A0ABY8HEA1_ENSAD|nr:hypothetical protein [Ensifer adhaerens]ANK73730.1 hypothetical protein FA04_14540 [Ensifer adhaerens]KDP70308.1 hypothetical protein FA04_29170 [Ensifer adhaerens]WFP89814.1 hypothetical protein P4B07_14770 [Ensifer adhaerens]